jgi:hypothetical protein
MVAGGAVSGTWGAPILPSGLDQWRCELQFDLRSGTFSREADLMLTKRGVSRVVQVDGRYRYQCTVPGGDFVAGLSQARLNLSAILNPYDVQFEVVEARARQHE